MKDPRLEPSELTTNRKALLVNLDQNVYGTFAEIGAGQEVARHFFKAGGAAGTIAKSMSAYDMKFSDEIYGKASRYVSRDRLSQMLDHEYSLLINRLSESRGDNTTFFVFANTVAAASYNNNKNCHGWMGMRYQISPNSPPSDIIIHVRMWDKTGSAQQEALGIAGVNFIWAALVYYKEMGEFIPSLIDNLGNERLEVDMLEFHGPDFEQVENRVVSLQLVEHGLTNAVMFGSDGSVLQPSEFLYKKSLLVERGSFRPITHVNTDMLKCAGAQFMQEDSVQGEPVVALLEITMKNLLAGGTDIDYEDFLARADAINCLGYHVLVSNYMEYYRLSAYFRRYTQKMIGIVLGINHLQEIFNEEYYEDLDGGILESFGRLFKANVKLYVYPMKGNSYNSYISGSEAKEKLLDSGANGFADEMLITADNLKVKSKLRHLYSYLIENHFIEPVIGAAPGHLDIFSRNVLRQITEKNPAWEKSVPPRVAELIKSRGLWGYGQCDLPEKETGK
ncbi:TonB-dependent receptor [Ruficoccus amylovorans]|uniref:TonB-dependent receptor n=1 Tax=Ruficoccus amylovorans TaxID=1804625 RepID=A0A842HI68_9BACT|nr:TonB-dependent receptor [Ruficoccus amylovorans]MBC2596049.1 TonB-dependent receptor [Ruficoccus amylovorans]